MKVRMTLVAVSALLLSGGNAWAAPFTGLYAFGDSLSDAGDSPSAVMSLYKTIGNMCDPTHFCPPYFDGRISNGPVASEQLANALFPGAVTSTNFRSYAVAGAGSGDQNSGFDIGGVLKLPGMKQELDTYMTDSKGVADPNALYFIWGGGNDYLTKDSPVTAAQNIGGYVSALATAGAQHFLIPNLPDLSLNPFIAGEGDAIRAEARAFSIVFNTELATQLNNVSSSFPTADIFQFDTYSFLNTIVSDPAAFGFVNPQDECLNSVLIACGNPDAHIYWDDFHPTTRAHGLLGAQFAVSVPEPEVAAMLMMGLAIVGFAARTRGRSERDSVGKRGIA